MADDFWDLTDPDTGEMKKFDGRFVLNDIKKTLGYRDVNIVKKVEMQLGKFGDESIYKKDEKAKNFSNGVKKGVELSNKIFMPLLFVLFTILVVQSLRQRC
jgi:hypothetical protein